ncbi:MAG: hypothetical protein E7289_03700 [Lachnospiraceae bacterium]|nr:hypothetical protein [Lachnospiraceae bacterium]
MKVRCKECNKRFDYDVYSGVCPKCGNYMRPNNTTTENDNCSMEGSHTHVESMTETYTESYTQPKRESNYAEPEPKKKSNVRLTFALLIAIIIMAAGTTIFLTMSQAKVHQEMTVQDLRVVTLSQKDVIEYKGESNLYEIKIDSVTVDKDPEFDLPEPYEAIVISYSIDRTFLGGEGRDYDSFYEIQLTPYMETLSGYYIKPVSEYSIRDAKGIEDYEQAEEMGLGERFRYKQGVLYYFVKKDDIKGLHITSADYDSENYEKGALREIIYVDGLEVTR